MLGSFENGVEIFEQKLLFSRAQLENTAQRTYNWQTCCNIYIYHKDESIQMQHTNLQTDVHEYKQVKPFTNQ